MKICLQCSEPLPPDTWNCVACGWNAAQINGLTTCAPEFSGSGDGFDAEAFALLAKTEEKSFWFVNRNRLIIWALQAYFPDTRSFFEVGCGTGFVLSGIAQAYPALHLTGSELFPEGLQFAAQRLPQAELLQMDARKIPFVDEFDVVGAFDVLEHIEEDELVLQQIFLLFLPGGSLMLTVPQHQFLWSQVDEESHHVRRYSAQDLRTKVEREGFSIIRSTSFVSFLLPALLFSRFKSRASENQKNSSCELELPSRLNTALDWVMRSEAVGLRLGLNYPCGGSLLLLGRKPTE